MLVKSYFRNKYDQLYVAKQYKNFLYFFSYIIYNFYRNIHIERKNNMNYEKLELEIIEFTDVDVLMGSDDEGKPY